MYICADGTIIFNSHDTMKIGDLCEPTVLRNEILLKKCEPPVIIVSGTQMCRDMTKIIVGGPGKTYTFPRMVTTVCQNAFHIPDDEYSIISVKFNEGLETLENGCF